MAYCGPMGYSVQFSAHQVGGRLELWDKRGYGLPGVWVRRGSTVIAFPVGNYHGISTVELQPSRNKLPCWEFSMDHKNLRRLQALRHLRGVSTIK